MRCQKQENPPNEVQKKAPGEPEKGPHAPQPKLGTTEQKADQQVQILKNAAAIRIQTAFRVYLEARLTKAKAYIDNPSNLSAVPRAVDGNTPVYFPNDLPRIVLKQDNYSRNRSTSMLSAQQLIARNQFNHLIVPKWHSYKGYLIEERLPIRVNAYEQIGLYLSFREEFTKAIEELAEFFCQANLGDLMERGSHPLCALGRKVRYDNLPIYTSYENGKRRYLVGLIDLEAFSLHTKVQGLDSLKIYDRLNILARFFPHHLPTILSVGRRHSKEIGLAESRFVAVQTESHNFQKVAYEDYLKFLQQNNITSGP